VEELIRQTFGSDRVARIFMRIYAVYADFHFLRHCGVANFRRLEIVTGRFSRHLAKWMTSVSESGLIHRGLSRLLLV